MVIVNKIDLDSSKLKNLVLDIKKAFGNECLPVNLPADQGTKVVDCFHNDSGESDIGPVAEAHKQILEQIVEVDEDLMTAYLEEGAVSEEKLRGAFQKALREGHVVPICFVSARDKANPENSVGIAELLDFLINLLPSPSEGNIRRFFKLSAPEIDFSVSPDPSKHVIAHVFAISIDPFIGKLSVVRIHQGTITPSTLLYITDTMGADSKKPFKVGHFFKLQGKEHIEIASAGPGDIIAFGRVDETHRDVVIHDHHDEDGLLINSVKIPEPMYGLAISAKSKNDEQKFAEVLSRCIDEDPALKLVRDRVTHETVLYGIGDLHLRVILERFKNRYKLEVDSKPPKVSYRETIMKKADGHNRHKKQTGGAGQFGEVFLRIEPMPRGGGFEFVDEVVGGNIPNQFIPAVEKGVKAAMENGALAGFTMQDIRVAVYDGKYHPVDSKEIAFISAGKKAFLEAFMKAKPVLLEPIVKVEIMIPQGSMGDVNGNLTTKRGRIQDTEVLPGDMMIVRAIAPLAELMNYQNELKSMTGGQGGFSMEFSHYDVVPDLVQKELVNQYKPEPEEED